MPQNPPGTAELLHALHTAAEKYRIAVRCAGDPQLKAQFEQLVSRHLTYQERIAQAVKEENSL